MPVVIRFYSSSFEHDSGGYIICSSYLSRFMQNPTIFLWKSAKHILRYLKGTKSLDIVYHKGDSLECSSINEILFGYRDSDWAQKKPQRKSISGNVLMMAGGSISWRRKKQSCVARSSQEYE